MATNPLAVYLRRNNLSKSEFARRAGVHNASVSRWVSGQRRPDLEAAVAIERATAGAIPALSWLSSARRAA